MSEHTQTSQSVDAIDIHRTRAADALAARPPEGQSGINLVLDADERVQHHGTGLLEIELVSLHFWLRCRLIRIPSVNVELLNLRSGSILNRCEGTLGNGWLEQPGCWSNGGHGD